MIYKAFAAVTLIAAPIIVLTVQSFVPQTNQPAASSIPPAPSTTIPVVAPAVQPAPPPPAVNDPVASASFGQPVPEAAKPFLTPGAGLPDADTVEQAPLAGTLPPPDGPAR
ncbi:hypothetical protein [Sphingobium sp.]|uniref:hypothetical protein n=1 Tax=Sphingobium sp. TaxID=1912891 RepID=UPI0028BE14C6|nr:hypothetical protein [Sphingobium sp.]